MCAEPGRVSSVQCLDRTYVKNVDIEKILSYRLAVDTEVGLVVPVIRNVDSKGILELSEEVVERAELARARKLGPDHMAGGCFTVSSLGAIGGTGFTPIFKCS
ncbi:MAG: hypothetical protein CM1200mP9_00980 [Gammaproteobacteria bacterium]|nr:MAG: hypothetical protein CM1200mP9_00980 [Gammaproteobacteria bacterium]